MIAKFDCVTWSIDKNKTHMFEWYPGRPYMNRLPYNYTVSANGYTLIQRLTGMPVIDYGYGGFKVLRSFTDWEMYICLNQGNGVLTLETGIELGIGAVVAGGIGGTAMKITGNATLMYHDSIWSRSSVEIRGVKIKGIEDSSYGNIPFIYCSGFAASDVEIHSVNRIFSKGAVHLKNAFIRDGLQEIKFTDNIMKNKVMPGMYIYSEGELLIEDSDIFIHNHIEAGMVTVLNSHLVVQNIASANLVLYSLNRILLDNSIVDISRGKKTADIDVTLDLVFIEAGNLIVQNNSRITAVNNDSEVMEYDCIMLNAGRIVINNGQIRTSAYTNAINVKCYGNAVINPTGGEIRKNCDFVTVSGYDSVFRFQTELDGYRLWVYVSGKVVTDIQYISGDRQYKRYEPEVYKAYIQNHIDELLAGLGSRECFAYMTAAASVYGEVDKFRIEAL